MPPSRWRQASTHASHASLGRQAYGSLLNACLRSVDAEKAVAALLPHFRLILSCIHFLAGAFIALQPLPGRVRVATCGATILFQTLNTFILYSRTRVAGSISPGGMADLQPSPSP